MGMLGKSEDGDCATGAPDIDEPETGGVRVTDGVVGVSV